MKRAVIGVGSPFGADWFGWQVVDQLQNILDQAEIGYCKLDRPGSALLQQMEGYQQVVLVDAIQTDSDRASELIVLDQPQLLKLSQQKRSTHALGIAETVALGNVLNDLPPQLQLVGVGVVDLKCEVDEALVKQGVEQVLALLKV
ncbi:MAG: hydrogenase maturation protease [Gammaproteobacteria bacterium]|uniref:Hydrogenase maturation protease n=1 Tax=Candidatus Thiopontia autotrophica TaxID=2841688 RepID=A0A8J6NXN8_9GAMM|nr:hydrogenase maturation protease [Candidatus Thiopontia autotrophica]